MQEHLQSRIDEACVPQIRKTCKCVGMSSCLLSFRMGHHEVTGAQIEIQAVQVGICVRAFQDEALEQHFHGVSVLRAL